MTQPQHSPSPHVEYYSAHRGLVWGSDGAFHHFARQCDPIHTSNGYWRFSTFEDDRGAYKRGFRAPEDVLIAQDGGDGTYDDIILRWVPGTLDEGNKTTVGTPAQHLEAIYSERRVLGKSLSFRGRVPLYPISSDMRLITHRVMRYGAQKGASPCTTPVLLTQRQPRNDSQSVVSSPTASTKSTLSQDPSAVLLSVSADRQSDKQILRQSRSNQASNADGCGNHSNTTRLYPQPAAPHMTSFTQLLPLKLPAGKFSGVEEGYSTAVHGVARCTSYKEFVSDVLDESTNSNPIVSMADLMPSTMFEAMNASLLPCLDCGAVGDHTNHCWIRKATLSLRPAEELSVTEYRELAENVQRFDPGPWITHISLPREVLPDDPELQLQGKAHFIRTLDDASADPDLQMLDEQLMVLSWTLQRPDYSARGSENPHPGPDLRKSDAEVRHILGAS